MLVTLDRKESQIIQQNKILLGGQTINLRARQMIYVLAALMNKESPTDTISFGADEFLGFINNTPGEKWSDIYALANHIFDHLNKNPILIKEPRKKDFVKINWLSRLGVVGGKIEARFSTDIAEYFLYKQGLPYTKLLWDLRLYNSTYTARIMDLFQKYHNKGSGITDFSFEYDVEQLKLFFGVHDKYQRFYDFEKRVLKNAEKELEENDHVPYWFEYSKIKQGRNVVKIAFEVYVRPKILLEMAPELKFGQQKDSKQINIFDLQEQKEFSNNKKKVLERLDAAGVQERFAKKIVSNLTDTQAIGYVHLIEYGVNRNLAFTLVREHCSFGELHGVEHEYIKYTLDKIEADRVKRIKESEEGKSKKRVTPEDKRGGLPKKVLTAKQHFSAFMEVVSQKRKTESLYPKKNRGGDFSSIGDLIKKAGSLNKQDN